MPGTTSHRPISSAWSPVSSLRSRAGSASVEADPLPNGSPITARHWRIGLDGEPGIPGRVLILSLELLVEVNVLPSVLCFLNIHGGRLPQGFGCSLGISLGVCLGTLGLLPVG